MELAPSFTIIISYPLLLVTLKESVAQLLQHSNSNPFLRNKQLPYILLLLLKTESLNNAILELWLAYPSWYMSNNTMFSKYGNCTRLLKIRNKLKTGSFFVRVFNKTIIPLALVGYEMIIANLVPRASLAIHHLICNAHSWNNC